MSQIKELITLISCPSGPKCEIQHKALPIAQCGRAHWKHLPRLQCWLHPPLHHRKLQRRQNSSLHGFNRI